MGNCCPHRPPAPEPAPAPAVELAAAAADAPTVLLEDWLLPPNPYAELGIMVTGPPDNHYDSDQDERSDSSHFDSDRLSVTPESETARITRSNEAFWYDFWHWDTRSNDDFDPNENENYNSSDSSDNI